MADSQSYSVIDSSIISIVGFCEGYQIFKRIEYNDTVLYGFVLRVKKVKSERKLFNEHICSTEANKDQTLQLSLVFE